MYIAILIILSLHLCVSTMFTKKYVWEAICRYILVYEKWGMHSIFSLTISVMRDNDNQPCAQQILAICILFKKIVSQSSAQ